MLPQKNIDNINKIIEKYEIALQKMKSMSKTKNALDANNICKNIIIMYNDVIIASYNIYNILLQFTKNPDKNDVEIIMVLFEKLKNSQCQFIDKTVNVLLKTLNIPIKLSAKLSHQKYVELSYAVANKLELLKQYKLITSLRTPVLDKIKNFADSISEANPATLSGYLASDTSKFLDHILAFCLSYTNYIESIISSINLIKNSDMKTKEYADFFSDYIEFFKNVTKNKKEINVDICQNSEKLNQLFNNLLNES